MLLIALGALLGLCLLIVLASVAEHVAYAGSVLPGVRIDGTQVGGKKETNARAAVEQLAQRLDTATIHVHAGSRRFAVDPSLIGFSVDAEAIVREARSAGRNSNLLRMVSDTVLRRFRSDDVSLVVHYDQTRFEGLLDGWTSALQSGLVEGGLRFEGTKVVPVHPQSGRGLLRDHAEQSLRALLTSASRSDLELPVGEVTPEIDEAGVAAAAAGARSLLTGSFVVVARATRVTLGPARIAPTLGTRIDGHTLDLAVDPEKLRFVLGPAFAAVERPPVEASFDVSNANAVTVVPSRDGRQLDLAEVGAAILGNKRSIVATVRSEHPAHDTAWAKALGISHQVSSFTTNYLAGEPRVHNIHLAADVLNNTVVPPGRTFSLNDKLGPRTAEKGYVKAPIILEDGFGEDYGGGISQLTTTLFNAVFFGGYVDVDHSPHHYYISRYPMGREATIVFPYVDLKFRNDTKSGVLIHASYNDTSITVTFYGDTDGRVATEANRKILKTEPITDRIVPCPAGKPTEDPHNDCAHLTAFERETTVGGETGYDVAFDRVILQPGKPPVRQHYQVHYPMLQNTVLIGTAPAAPTTTTTVKSKPTTTAPHTSASKPATTPTTAHH